MARTKAFDVDQVLDKALQLFWRQGYDATSVGDLVKELGLSRSSIYDTFTDKRQLFLAALERYRHQTSDVIIAGLAEHPQPKQALQQLLKMAVDKAVVDPDHKGCFMANTTVELANCDTEIAALGQRNKTRMVNAITEAIRRSQQAGTTSTTFSAEQLAESYFTLYNGLQVVSKLGSDKAALMLAIEPMIALLD